MIYQDIWLSAATPLFEFRKAQTVDYCLPLVFFRRSIYEWLG
jgi:hypothetical protein